MNLEQLRARLAELAARIEVANTRRSELAATMQPLLERSELTEDDTTSLDVARSEFEAIEAELGSIETRDGLLFERSETERLIGVYERALGSIAAGNVTPGAPAVHTNPDPYERSLAEVPRSEVRDLAMRAIERDDVMGDAQRGDAERMVRAHGERMAQHMLATNRPEYRSAWLAAMAGQEHLLTDAERSAVLEMRAMSLTDAAGGYAVPFTLDPTVIDTSDGTVNPFRSLARIERITTDSWNGVSSAGVTARWAAEASEAADNSPTFAQPSIPVHKADSFVPFSFEIGMDFANLAGEVQRMIMVAKDDLEAAAHANGTGSGQPTGVVYALNATDGTGSDYTVDSDANDTFASVDLRGLWTALPAKYRQRATYAMNAVNLDAAQAFGNSGDADFSVYLTAEGARMLKGRPTAEASEMADDRVLFGDFSNYVIVDRIGMVTSLVPHLFGSNNRPTGQSGFYAYWRTGANTVNNAAFRLLKVTAA